MSYHMIGKLFLLPSSKGRTLVTSERGLGYEGMLLSNYIYYSMDEQS